MNDAQQVFDLLKQCRRMQTEACFAVGGVTDVFQGQVCVSQPSEVTLRIAETGIWQGRRMPAENTYIWQLQAHGLSLLRQQHTKLLNLCHFTSANQWTDTHVCGQDTYQGSIVQEANQLILTWIIFGMNKQGVLTCYYYS